MTPKPLTRAPVHHTWIAKLWLGLGLYGRIALIIAVAILAAWLAVVVIRKISRGRWKRLLWVFTGIFLIGFSGLSIWTQRLSEPVGGYFVVSHQIVRLGAVLCGAGFVLGFMALALPWVLDRIEGRGFVPFVAARHVRAGKSGFLTAISVLSILGVAVSSLALCLVVSVMGGFGADLKRKILGNNAHIKIEAKSVGGFNHWRPVLDDVRLVPGVRAATPVAQGEAMASSTSGSAGVIVRGVDTQTIGTVIDILKNIQLGKFDYLNHPGKLAALPPDTVIGIGPGGEKYRKGPDLSAWGQEQEKLDPDVRAAVRPPDVYPGIVIGRELAKTLHLYVGDTIRLVAPLGDLGPMGILPRSRKFRVAAIFYSGMYEYDASYVYTKLDVAQDFLDLKHNITAIEVKVFDAERVSEIRPGVEKAVAARTDLRVRDWKELNKNLFSALKLEKIATFIILSIAIAVASFCIICTLLLMVTEKSKEIAILKAVGASNRSILRIFITEGVIIGAIGTVFGVVTGLALALGLSWFGLRLDPDVYYVDRLPVSVNALDYTLVAISALVITTLATIYPALAASRLRPVEGIRYE
jgi:lipoprotein-releasing system permease protein